MSDTTQNLPQLYRFCFLMTGDTVKAQEVRRDPPGWQIGFRGLLVPASAFIATLRTAKRLVSLNCDLARSKRGRCEILEAAAYGAEPGAVCSLIRICPWLEMNSNSYWSDQAGPPQGQVRLGQLASHKQEFFTT